MIGAPPASMPWEVWAIISIVVVALTTYGLITVARINRPNDAYGEPTIDPAVQLAITNAIRNHEVTCPGVVSVSRSLEELSQTMDRSFNNLCDRLDAQAQRTDETHRRIDQAMTLLNEKFVRQS